jgi:hypothetical protein
MVVVGGGCRGEGCSEEDGGGGRLRRDGCAPWFEQGQGYGCAGGKVVGRDSLGESGPVVWAGRREAGRAHVPGGPGSTRACRVLDGARAWAVRECALRVTGECGRLERTSARRARARAALRGHAAPRAAGSWWRTRQRRCGSCALRAPPAAGAPPQPDRQRARGDHRSAESRSGRSAVSPRPRFEASARRSATPSGPHLARTRRSAPPSGPHLARPPPGSAASGRRPRARCRSQTSRQRRGGAR